MYIDLKLIAIMKLPTGKMWILWITLACFLSLSYAQRCGWQVGGAVCPNNKCCSEWGWCGLTSEYCNDKCQSQCGGGSSGSRAIGVDFGQDSNELRSMNDIVGFLLQKNLKKIRLYHSQPETMRAFQGKGIELILSIPNDDLKGSGMAWNQAGADWWVSQNIDPYISNTPITMIAVGNEVTLTGDGSLIGQTLPAMRNMRKALDAKGYTQIKVSTPLAMDILGNSFPPSAGSFKDAGLMKPILEFLGSTKSTFLINSYTYFTYRDNPSQINLDSALLKASAPPVTDFQTGIVYRNLLFQQLDAVISAMKQQGYPDLPFIISETGWPSGGGNAASPGNAQTYNQNLINIVAKGQGTPLRPGSKIEAYIFALFNENLKGGNGIERNFGLFRPDLSPVYDINLGGNGLQTAEDNPRQGRVESF
ncbi:hypothetical protein R1flu_022410 [Riccia fluitans]|uniref:Chitin-binding type-1 domain-containing protein n=1 Tax=Riccia fluitans TaxID=41844 RepID=A0ABD1ZSI6_9MARC